MIVIIIYYYIKLLTAVTQKLVKITIFSLKYWSTYLFKKKIENSEGKLNQMIWFNRKYLLFYSIGGSQLNKFEDKSGEQSNYYS